MVLLVLASHLGILAASRLSAGNEPLTSISLKGDRLPTPLICPVRRLRRCYAAIQSSIITTAGNAINNQPILR